MNEVRPNETLPDYTVMFGDGQRRIDLTLSENPALRNTKQKGQEMHLELLRRLIPNASSKWS